MNKPIDNEVVVKFQSALRKVTLYFEQNGDGLDMSMVMDPEFDPEKEEPDLVMLLASTLMNALQTENKEDDSPKVYDGS